MFLLERNQLAELTWNAQTLLPLSCFAGALFCFYSLVPLVLLWGGAAVLNLSLLSSDLWAAAARLALFGGFGGSAGYFVGSLLLVASGLCIYTLAGGATKHAAGTPAHEAAHRYQRLQSQQLVGHLGEGGGCDGDSWGGGHDTPRGVRDQVAPLAPPVAGQRPADEEQGLPPAGSPPKR